MWLISRRLVSRSVARLLGIKGLFSTLIKDGGFARFKPRFPIRVGNKHFKPEKQRDQP